MLYIEIPEDMEYKALESMDSTGNPMQEDFFVSKDGEKPNISIQKAVRELQHSFYRKSILHAEVQGLLIHKKKPVSAKPLLEYRPNNSGCLPTDHAVVLARSTFTHTPGSRPPYARWISDTPLSPKSEEKAKAKEEAQKLNRRKWGDSPSSN